MSFFPSHTHDLFITHHWYYTDPWQELVGMLDVAAPGQWRNWSLPWHDTSIEKHSEKGRAQLERLLRGQIASAGVMLVIPETASTNDGKAWLEVQLRIAAEQGTPIVGVRTVDGQFPEALTQATCEVVDRTAGAIFSAAERLRNRRVDLRLSA